jgi:class 3 adenylate cyclase
MSGNGTQRRLAAILAADVVGYSRLMGKDEAGTLAALKAVRTFRTSCTTGGFGRSGGRPRSRQRLL